MRKYLMTGVAAIALAAAFTSCSKSTDLYDQAAVDQREKEQQQQKEQAKIDQIKTSYEEAFINTFGQPSATHTWGFGSARSTTRASAVITGDPFTFESTDSYFKTEAPTTAKTIDDYRRADWGGKIDENALQSCKELKVEGGEGDTFTTFAIHCWEKSRDIYVSGNVTFNVDNTNSFNQARIYLLPGSKLNFNMDSYINDLEIYVANNATLNYNADKLYKQTGGGKIYNRGTVNFQDNFEANQNAIVYNEGTINGKNITSKPGDGNQSFFYNFGDLSLSGKLELNSCANFYNEGTVTVTGETSVTQQKIYWINKGKYTTGTMVFSAKNSTFYNFCQLLILGNAHMYDGEFNLMDNSYTQAASADFDNFIVNMGNNSGFNVLGDTDWAAQGDGTYQGFRTTAGATNAYVRLGGTTTVAGHLHSLELTGNITYAINNIVDKGAGNSGVQPTYVFNEGTTEAPFDKLTVTPNATGCGATWIIDGGNGYQGRIMAEDLNAKQGTDFDFNDVVFDWKIEGNEATIQLLAAGGIYPLYVGDQEVHAKFGKSAGADGNYPMINTGAGETGTAQPYTYTFPTGTDAKPINIPVVVEIDGTRIPLEASMGGAASKINTTTTTKWAKERADFRKAYSDFTKWVADENFDWTKTFDVNFLYTE